MAYDDGTVSVPLVAVVPVVGGVEVGTVTGAATGGRPPPLLHAAATVSSNAARTREFTRPSR
jgi:hypothetical protein